MGEDITGMATTTSQLQAKLLALTGGRVDIMIDENTFKNSTQILREMAGAWEYMTDIQRANALELMGGKRQANILSALIQNFDTVEEVIEASANSAGSAIKENERYLDSIQGKIDQFNNAVQAMWNDTLDSDVVKNFVELATTLVKILDAVGPLNIAFVGMVTFLEKKYNVFSNLFSPAKDGFELLRTQMAQAEKDLKKKEAAHKAKGTVETADALKKSEDYYNSLKEKAEPYEDVERLRNRRDDLLAEQSDAQMRSNIPLLSEEAKKDLNDINIELDQTNKELAEAEARLAKIDKNFKPSTIPDVVDDGFDAAAVKKSRTITKSKRTRRINQLQKEGKSFDEINNDALVKQYTKEIEESNRALAEHETLTQQADAALKQKNATTAQAAATESAKATAEKADNVATATGAEVDAVAALATDGKTASTLKDVIATAASKGATMADVAAKLKQWMIMKLLNTEYVKQQIATGALTKAKMADMTMTQLLGLGFKGLAASIWGATKAMIAFMVATPVGWILLIVAAVAGAVAAFVKWGNTAKNLREDLNNLKSEISDIKSELETLNDELETTQERMSELLAKDSLTFTEQEELENLQKQNDELEREIYLLEQREQRLQRQAHNTFDDLMGKRKNLGISDEEGNVYDWSLERNIGKLDKWTAEYEAAKRALVNAEKELDAVEQSNDENAIEIAEERVKIAEKQVEKAEKKVDKFQGKVDKELNQYFEDADGIDYASADEETRKYLDYIYNTEGRLNISGGDDLAKTHEIKRIFNKDNMSETSEEIDRLVEQLSKNPDDATIIGQISEQCKAAQKDLEAVGLSVKDAADYFTQLGKAASFDTLEGKTNDISIGAEAMTKLLSGLKDGSVKVDDVFNGEGKVIQTALSEMFRGTSEQTRADATRILESAYEGIADGLEDGEIERLVGRLGVKLSASLLDVKKTLQAESNLEIFPNLEEELDGIIDTFSELSSAVNNVVDAMDTLEQARAEEAYSGSISLETMMKLMEYTDDYAKILEIDEYGAIKLVAGAEEILVEEKLKRIKADAQLALESAEVAYQDALTAEQEAIHAEQTMNVTSPAQEWYRDRLADLAAMTAYVGSLWNSITTGNFNGMLDRAKEAAAAAKADKITADESKKAEVSEAVKAAQTNVAAKEQERDEAAFRNEFAQSLTADNLQTKANSDDASGGNNTKKEAEEDLAQQEWERLINKYENKLALINNERDRVQAEIDKAEANGGKASKEMYDDLIRLELEEKQLLQEKKAELENYLDVYGDSIDPETWTDYNNEINATAVAIEEATSNIYEFAQSLRDIDMHYFEQATNEISRLAEEISWVMSLFEDEDMYDEAGSLTEAGVTKINLLRDQMTAYAGLSNMWSNRLTDLNSMQKGANGLYAFDENTKKAIAEDFQSMFNAGNIDKATYDNLMKQLADAWSAGGFSEEIMTEWKNEAEDGVRDAISSQKDIRNEMLSMYDEYLDKLEEGVQKEIEAYQDLIDAQKEELDAARELNDFRKQIANDSKGIQELERRIASLSGSTAAADVAERRRLEAQLNDKRSELEDRYYEHASDARSNALDDEADAYASAKNRYVEIMRETREDTEWVINEMITNGIFNADVANAFLTRIQETYNAPLSSELTTPWNAAAERATEFKNQVGIIASEDIPPSVTMMSDSIRGQLATDDDNNPWNQAIAMADRYADFLTNNEFTLDSNDLNTFSGQINTIVSKWNNVKKAADDAYAAQSRTYDVGGNPNVGDDDGGDSDPTPPSTPSSTPTQNASTGPNLVPNGKNSSTIRIGSMADANKKKETINGVEYIKASDGYYYPLLKLTRVAMNQDGSSIYGFAAGTNNFKYNPNPQGSTHKIMAFAKGTLGTKRDQWALTDETQYGDELVLIPGKDGNLSFMRKGTSVVPADLTANLMEWGQFTPDSMNLGGGVNVNMINNAVMKPQYDFHFDSLVHVDHCDQNTIKDLEKMVDNKIDKFSKDLNYSIKRFSR